MYNYFRYYMFVLHIFCQFFVFVWKAYTLNTGYNIVTYCCFPGVRGFSGVLLARARRPESSPPTTAVPLVSCRSPWCNIVNNHTVFTSLPASSPCCHYISTKTIIIPVHHFCLAFMEVCRIFYCTLATWVQNRGTRPHPIIACLQKVDGNRRVTRGRHTAFFCFH